MISVSEQHPTRPTDATQRQCAACRGVAARDELLRIVVEAGRGVPDIRRRLPGRGVSVHPTRACIQQAVKQGRLGSVSAADMIATACAQYRRRMEGLIIAAFRARQLAVGTEAVRDALRQRTLRMLLVAKDASGDRDDLERAAAMLERRCVTWGTKQELGGLLGRETLAVVGLLDDNIAEELRSAAQHIAALAEDA